MVMWRRWLWVTLMTGVVNTGGDWSAGVHDAGAGPVLLPVGPTAPGGPPAAARHTASGPHPAGSVQSCLCSRALCRIQLLPDTHVLVATWMLTVKLVYKLSNCAWWPEMGYKRTYDTIYTHFQGITNNIYGFGRLFLLLQFFTRPPYFYPSIVGLPVQMTGGWVST